MGKSVANIRLTVGILEQMAPRGSDKHTGFNQEPDKVDRTSVWRWEGEDLFALSGFSSDRQGAKTPIEPAFLCKSGFLGVLDMLRTKREA